MGHGGGDTQSSRRPLACLHGEIHAHRPRQRARAVENRSRGGRAQSRGSASAGDAGNGGPRWRHGAAGRTWSLGLVRRRRSFRLIDARMFIPTKAFLTKGVGRHKEKLTSFEMALGDREEGMSMLRPGQVVFAVIAESATNEPSRLVAASIGVAMPADPSHHGYISEHHSYGQSESVSGEYAEDLAASMLATVLGVPFEADKAWDERREQWLLSGEIVRTMNVTSTAECGADGRWTTVVSAVAFCG